MLTKLTLRHKLILTLILLLVPLLVADIYYHYDDYMVRHSDDLEQYRESALDLARNAQLLISRTVAIEKSVGKTLEIAHWRSKAIRYEYLESVAGSDSILSNIAITNADGMVLDVYPPADSANISDRDYFKSLKNGSDWVVSDLLINRLDNNPGFIVASAIRRNGQFHGVVLTRIDEERVNQILSTSENGKTILVLADKQGNITFINSRPSLSYQQRLASNYSLKLEHPGVSKLITDADLFDKKNLKGALAPVSEIGWTAGVFAPAGQILLNAQKGIIRDVLTLLAIFVATIILGTFIVRQLTESVEQLSDAAEKLGEGHFDTRIAPPRVAEFAILANTMNSMAASIQQRDEDLQQAYQRERRISTAFQESMLPDVPAQIGRMELATAYYPALQEAELGGDFYDVNILPNGLACLLVADVSGKGLDAAVHTATAKYALQGFAYENPDPARALSRLSAVLYDNTNNEKFVTAFFAVLDTGSGKLVYANAGHPQPILRHKDGSTEWLEIASGPPLGVSMQPNYVTHELFLHENDVLVSYTDGVIEARNGLKWFGMEGLEAIMHRVDSAPREVVCAVHKTVSDFVSGELLDDIALLAVRMSATALDGPISNSRKGCD